MLATAIVLSFAAPAIADEYYVVRVKTTKVCSDGTTTGTSVDIERK
jgi:hypothetical protein